MEPMGLRGLEGSPEPEPISVRDALCADVYPSNGIPWLLGMRV